MSDNSLTLVERIVQNYNNWDQIQHPAIRNLHKTSSERECWSPPQDVSRPGTSLWLLIVINITIAQIKAGERLKITVPRSFSHLDDLDIDWDVVDNLHTDLRSGDHGIPPDVFVTIRTYENINGRDDDVVVDICHI